MRLGPSSTRAAAALLTALALALTACSGSGSSGSSGSSGAQPSAEPSATSPAAATLAGAAPDPVVVVAVGDIACPSGEPTTGTTCRDAETAELAAELDPDAVLALGDLQYEHGTLRAFRNNYADTWGALKSITYPVPGNHEYHTRGAAGYYRYFSKRQPGSPGYYAFDLGGWRVYALNSVCEKIRCKREYRWLVEDLEANPRACSLFAMHYPRYSSGGEHGSMPRMTRFFRIAYRHDVDLVLAGHDHDYERFRRMNAVGDPRRKGVMEIVSGAGGKSLYSFGKRAPGSAYRLAHVGVLRLGLRAEGFRFAFKDVDGTTPDSGKRRCV